MRANHPHHNPLSEKNEMTTTNRTTALRCLAAGAQAVALAGTLLMAATAGAAVPDAQPGVPVQVDTPTFPDIGSAWMKEGIFATPEMLRTVGPGMTKDQVYAALGRPHFSEGMFGVREWNYILNFRPRPAGEVMRCQLLVRFDAQYRLQSTHWREAQCAALAARGAIATQALAAEPATAVPSKLSLSADSLFAFGGASEADMLPEGRRKLERLAADLRSNQATFDHVLVTGHTDRFGSQAYNQALSLQRADTVRDLLVRGGVQPQKIRTAGIGEQAPRVDNCIGTQHTQALERCLQPNRRVDLSVVGAR